jgi:DNA-binding transcriptional MocR family regulator
MTTRRWAGVATEERGDGMRGDDRLSRLLASLGDWTRGQAPMYAALADGLLRAIDRGDLPAATRLPAERTLAVALNVSRGTVMAAYDQLRLAGVLDSRQGSGTWVRPDTRRSARRVDDDPSAVAVRARRLGARLLEPTDDVIDLALGAAVDISHIPDHCLQPPDRGELQQLAARHGYQPLGLPALRERIASYLRADGIAATADEVAVTSGSQQAISLITELLVRPGDAVVVETPTYPGALDAFTRAGARIVSIAPESEWAGPHVLRDAVTANAPRLVYLMPACHNPTGRIMTDARRDAVVRVAEELDTFVVEDNILADVTFAPRRLAPLAARSRTDRILTLGSLSKVAWGGLRVGWVRGPRGLIDRMGRLRVARDFGSPVLPQLVASNILDDLPAIAAAQVRLLEERLTVSGDLLHRLLPTWTWSPPDGGLVLWLSLPEGDADDVAQLALRHGVDVSPGSAHATDDEQQRRIRLSYGQPPEVLRLGIERLATAWAAYTGARGRIAG